jgi:two-component system chemotaxis sensor kinase CheA
VILLTSHGDDETRRKGLEAGADGYVVKAGFDQFALLDHVQKALGHQLRTAGRAVKSGV